MARLRPTTFTPFYPYHSYRGQIWHVYDSDAIRLDKTTYRIGSFPLEDNRSCLVPHRFQSPDLWFSCALHAYATDVASIRCVLFFERLARCSASAVVTQPFGFVGSLITFSLKNYRTGAQPRGDDRGCVTWAPMGGSTVP